MYLNCLFILILFIQVNKQDSIYHECGVVFFYPGQYKLNLQCQTLKQHIWKLIPPLQLDITAE